ncbi:hypothetical protein GCM10022381_06640 [Leifsonia kafniensis]|uniref:ABC transporter ATP-binding protein n=1 Tax=Leifsonia kafniensis TaxID=475957 RepID=A0ABP7K5D4_9MICO
MPEMADPPGAANEPVASPSVRAQLLATEHWSLLASRSTTQSEVLTRISMFLTLTSAALVSLALVGQANDFDGIFPSFAVVVLAIVLLVGLLTQLRVMNTMMEDLQYVIAMNVLRAAYAELDPGIERYFMSSRFDDLAGSRQTYYFLGPRGPSQVLGSSMTFIVAVNSTLLGLLTAAAAGFITASAELAAAIGAAVGLALFAFSLWRSTRVYFRFWKRYTPQFPTPPTPPV